jgi:hypothetical protein
MKFQPLSRIAAALATAAVVAALLAPTAATAAPPGDGTPFVWGTATTINNVPTFTDAGPDARNDRPGNYGSQFPRMTELADGSWVIAYTIYDNNGYTYDPGGGTRLQIATSTDDGRSWSVRATLAEGGRDIDNGQIVQLPNGDLLLTYRSVIWGQSYRLPVKRSSDGGVTWTSVSTIDANEGTTAGSLSNPDRGVYEPYMQVLPNGNVAVMYANEKYALSNPAYAQVISMKVSSNNGASWGTESFPVRDTSNSAARPGMPVFDQMDNGSWVMVYELCGTDACNAYVKTSSSATTWPVGMGTRIPFQTGAPYVLSLSDGRLVATSNTHEISISRDYGATWFLNDTNPFGPLATDDNLWPALVQTGPGEIGVVTSAGRPPAFNTGHNIQIKFGTFSPYTEPAISNNGTYGLTAQHSGLRLDITGGSMLDGAQAQQWTATGANPQRWTLRRQSDGSYMMQNVQSSKYLEVDANSISDGARVQQWAATGCACQKWFFDYVGSGLYQVRAAHSNKMLDVAAGSTAAGAIVQQWPDNDARPQRWRLVP